MPLAGQDILSYSSTTTIDSGNRARWSRGRRGVAAPAPRFRSYVIRAEDDLVRGSPRRGTDGVDSGETLRRRRARGSTPRRTPRGTTRRVGRARRGAGTNARRGGRRSKAKWRIPRRAPGRRRRRRRTAPARGAGGSKTCRRPGSRVGTRRGVWSGWDSPRGRTRRPPEGARRCPGRASAQRGACARDGTRAGAVRPVDAARKAGLKQENVERRGGRGGGGAHRRPPGAPRAERWREEATTVGRSSDHHRRSRTSKRGGVVKFEGMGYVKYVHWFPIRDRISRRPRAAETRKRRRRSRLSHLRTAAPLAPFPRAILGHSVSRTARTAARWTTRRVPSRAQDRGRARQTSPLLLPPTPHVGAPCHPPPRRRSFTRFAPWATCPRARPSRCSAAARNVRHRQRG